MNNDKEKIENAKKNSIGKNDIQPFKPKSKVLISGILTVAVATLTTISAMYLSNKINIKDVKPIVTISTNSHSSDYDVSKVMMYMNERDVSVQQEMNRYGLKAYSIKGEPIVNELEDYKKIKTLDENKLYYYYRVLGEKESEKVAITLGYENWNDFLIKNNYYDENGLPNFDEWKEYEKKLVIEKVKNEGRSK